MSLEREEERADPGRELAPAAIASRDEDLLNAWDRLLAIAALYPAANARFHEAVEQWRAALRVMARADGSLCIEVGRDDRLAHEGRVQAPERVGRSRLYPLLTGIGVEHILLSLDIDAAALHELLAVLRETQRQAERSLGFQRAELPPLPGGVTIRLRSFGAPGESLLEAGAPAGGGASAGSGSGAAAATEAEGVGGTGPADAAGTGRGAAASAEPSGSQGPDMHNPHVGLQGGLAQNLEDRLTAQATALFQQHTQGVTCETVARPATPASAADPSPEGHRPLPVLPFGAETLKARLAGLDEAGPFDADRLGPNPTEWLAFLLQLALEEGDAADALRARARLGDALARELALQDVQTLVGAGESLLATGNAEQVDALLPLLLEPLAPQGQVLAAVLSALCEGLDARRRELLWPHLADALLRESAPPAIALVKGRDGESALQLAGEARARALARLEARPALQSGRLAAGVFKPPRPELRPLLTALLQSSRGAAAGALLAAALRESPPPAPYGALLALLGDFKPSQREFYRLLLADAEEAPALAQEAAALALPTLQRLPRQERSRPELVEVLLILAPAPPGEVDAWLDTVERERRFFLLPAWPAALRQAAARLRKRRASRGQQPGNGEARR